jgi:UV DNA damage endonuclease
MPAKYRLGVAVKVAGIPLRPQDSRRWQQQPHLTVSLAYLRDLLEYLHSHQIHFYRLGGQLAPYATHPAMPQFHDQLAEATVELAATGDLARLYNIRLSLHPAYYVRLSSPHPHQQLHAIQELQLAAQLLDAMGLGPESVVVIHVGGAYGDPVAGRTRFVQAFTALPAVTRSRLALENDDRVYGIEDLIWIHRRTGIRLVLDVLHHHCVNPTALPLAQALALALASWPAGQTPKIHYSSSRTELRRLMRNGRTLLQAPQPNQHSDFIQPFEFIEFLRQIRTATQRPFDIMLEAKAKELALLRLRDQLAHYAPDLAALVA